MIERCGVSMEKLGCKGTFPTKKPEDGSVPMWNYFPKHHNPLVEGIEKLTKNVFGGK